MSRVVVTGAAGFVGRGVVAALHAAGFETCALVRSPPDPGVFPAGVEVCAIAGLVEDADALAAACRAAATIVHLADNPERSDGESESPRLARAVAAAAVAAGVPRVVFASSIYATFDERGNRSAYGAGKRAAERLLFAAPGVDTVALRLPPVYGPGGKGGFALVTKLVGTGLPLPLGLARAPRAYLSRDNLASLIVALARADELAFAEAAGRVWEPSDGEPVSTADLARAVAAATGRKIMLLPVPSGLVAFLATLAGKREGAEAVFSPLACADDGDLRRAIGWQPSRDLIANLAYLKD